MKLNPQKAPLYGECVLSVQLDHDDVCRGEGEEDEDEDVEFYLMFSGSSQRHVSSTRRVSRVTLQAVCPAHNVCEQVLVTLCLARPGGPVDTHSQETFCFVQDLALDMAHFLLDSTAPQEALLLDDEQECEKLDQSLALALKHLMLPPLRTGPGVDGRPVVMATQEETCPGVTAPQDSAARCSQQQLSGLLHLAASHGLRSVALLLLQQAGGAEAVRSRDAQGRTALSLAEGKGHRELAELLTQYETSLNVPEEDKEPPPSYPEGRVFRHHASLDTYTLTLPETRSSETRSSQTRSSETRSSETRSSETRSSEDGDVQEEVEELRRRIQLHRDRKGIPDSADPPAPSRDPAGPASNGLSAVAIETSSTTEARGSPPSLEQSAQGAGPAAATQTPGWGGSPRQRQEVGGEPKPSPGANRGRRNRKRTPKTGRRAADSPGNPRSAAHAGGDRKSTGSSTGTPAASSEPAVTKEEEEETVTTPETPLPTSPGAAPGGDGKCADEEASGVEKQEGQKWEVDLLIREDGHAETGPELQVYHDPGPATMGQEQSQDPQESQSDPEDQNQADPTSPSPQSGRRPGPKSPSSERRPRRGLWPDGVRIGGRAGSPPQPGAQTVWYEGETLDPGPPEDLNKDGNSQSVWYDVSGKQSQEDRDVIPDPAPGPGSPQLLDQGPGLSQPHVAGPEPALSHGPTAQRQEGSQREEEVGPGWKEGDGEEVRASRKSSEDVEGERGAKGRKKRRKKRGRRGGAEAKLSSSSSIDSQSQIDVKREGGATGRAATEDAMRLPGAPGPESDPSVTTPEFSPTERGTTDLSEALQMLEIKELSEGDRGLFQGPDPDHLDPGSDVSKADTEGIMGNKDILELELQEPVEDSAVSGESEDRTGSVDRPEELPVRPSGPTEDSSLLEFPEHGVQRVRFLEPSGAADPASLSTFTESPAEAGDVRLEGAADVLPLRIQEGSIDTTAREYSEHCLDSEMLRDQQRREEESNGFWEGEEEASGRAENDSRTPPGEDSPSGDQDQSYNQDLAATAVAVVAVAIASAMASVEISQQLADNQEATGGLPNGVQATPLMDEDVCLLEQSGTDDQANDGVKQESESLAAPLSSSQDLNLDLDLETPGLPRLEEETRPNEDLTCPPAIDGVNVESLIAEECDLQVLENFSSGSGEDRQLEEPTNSPEESEVQHDGDASPLACVAAEGSDCQAKEHETDPDPDPDPEEPNDAAIVETDEHRRSPESAPDADLVPGIESVATSNQEDVIDDGEDLVDGWKEREKMKMKMEEAEVKEEVVKEDVMSQKAEEEEEAKEEEEEEEEEERHQTSTEIQRERDLFCPEPTAVTPCSDVHADREECVSVCVLHKDAVAAETDDGVFKRPRDPPPCGLRDRGVRVSWSSTDDAGPHGAVCPTEGPDAVSPRSSRLSWKSETEDRGGGEPEGGGGGGAGGGEEEEKKDQLLENPVSSAILRASIRSLSPFRRHSWEPGRRDEVAAAAGEPDVAQRSLMKTLSGDVKRVKPPLHRRSMSWCPSNLRRPDQEPADSRSYSLEGLEVERAGGPAPGPGLGEQEERSVGRSVSQERGSLVSLTEEEQEGDASSLEGQVLSVTGCPSMFHHQTLTKSVSMVTISQRELDVGGVLRSKRRISFSVSISSLLPKNRRFFAIGSSSSEEEEEEEEEEEGGRMNSFSSNSGSLEYSISEEEPGPLRSDTEGKGGPKISRTFSYLRSKMTKKGKEKEKERKGERERESKEREKKSGHVFVPVSPSSSSSCQHCSKTLHHKETFVCSNCGVHVHKCCRESSSVCTKSKTKQQLSVEAVPGSVVSMRSKSTSSTSSSISSVSSASSRERWSTATTPEDQVLVPFPRRHPGIFNPHTNLSKSISTSNIAGLDDVSLKGLKFLSQSTDSLHQGSKVNASTESLTDEGTEMMDSQLMGEFECDVKDLEADSWSGAMDKKFLKTLKKDEIKKQDVIYELYQTEFHHVRTLKIMTEVYYKGLQKELQLDTHTLDKIFPVLDDLLDTHTHFLTLLLERKRASSTEGRHDRSFLICSIGDVLLNQFSGCSAERMKKVYGKFCSRHNEAVNLYKDLHAKDKRFQAFIKRTMSSSIVRRLSIPECILLVTQRITKYPVLIQRILQHTKDSDEDHVCVCDALRCVKELITAVDSKVNEQEKKQRLREVYSRTDSKSIMRMKSGQMFAKEDLIRGRKLLHDGALQLKNSAGRLKDVQAMLLSDVLVFLQEKDQKFVFASLDQRSTVISLQNLIVREVANEERGLFLITAGIETPEMVEVLACSKEERNAWRAFIQDAMHCMEKDEDEGVPSETEEDRRQQENRAKEIRELLRRKDEQIISLLEEKVHIFRDLGDCSPAHDDANAPIRERMLFMATPDDVTKGEPIIKDALREVETLHSLVNSGVGPVGGPVGLAGGSVGPVCLPRRAETFGGFDSHQMNSTKNGEKEEGDESLDLRRTESDSVLKKGATASLQMLLKRNNDQVQHSVTNLHQLLVSLQAVVVQQDSFIEDQRQTLNERLTANSSRHSSSSSLSSSSSSRPSSLIEQEKHRSLERQRQEAATLQKQQAAHQEEKRRREKAWEVKERCLAEREERLRQEEEQTRRRRQEVTEEWDTLQRRKEEYQVELERLKEAQRRLERDKEALRRDTERLEAMRRDEADRVQRFQRTPSTTSEDSIRFHSSGSLDQDPKETPETPKVELSSSAPTKEPFLRIGSKRMGKNFNPFSSSSSSSSSSKPQGAEKEAQLPTRLLQLAKPKDKKDKRKKKGKGEPTDGKVTVMSDPQNDGDIFFC